MSLDLVKDITVLHSKDIVLHFIDNLNNLDFQNARRYVTDDLEFIGVLGSRNGGDNYLSDMERMKIKYSIQKVLFDETDVCLFYDLRISGKQIFGCGWYHLDGNNKIKSIKAIFDPRPLLES